MASGDLRTELAATAARLIAEEGCEYAQAKRRAVDELLGDRVDRRTTLPDNSEVEHELRRYLRLFGGAQHRALLKSRRELATEVMQTLREFEPHVIGAVLNGTATEHSDIHLQLFVDSAKDVELHLMNLGIDFDVDEGGGDERPSVLERLSYVVQPVAAGRTPSRQTPVGVRLHVYPRDGIRIAARHRHIKLSDEDMHPIEMTGRANLETFRKLIIES